MVTPLTAVEHYLNLKVVNLLKQEVHFEGLNPTPSGSVRGNLIKVDPLEDELLRVIPETKPDLWGLSSYRCFILRLMHIHSRRRNKKEAPFLGGACGDTLQNIRPTLCTPPDTA
jgi:hypothetical protein